MADGLIRLSVLSSSIFAQVAGRHELPAAQARLLCVLAGGPRRMSELAAMLGVEKAALTGLADRAERRGLIARTAVPGDRRALSLALTPGGFDAASAFHCELSAELARLTDVLPPAECARFSRNLDRITADAPWPLPRLRRYPGRVARVAGSAICVTILTRRVRRSVVFKLLPRTPAAAPGRYLPGVTARCHWSGGSVVGIIVGENRTPVAFESRHLSESGAGLADSRPAVRPDPDMLLGAVARGERGAFDLVYERFREPIHNQVFSVLRDLAQSEEVTQEVLLELWRTAVRYDQARGSATTWVLTIARRRAIDRVRSTAASAARDQRAAVSDATWAQAHEAAEDPFDHERLLHCLDQLSALQREAIALAFYGGLTHCQVADTLGVPLGTVKARIRDALIKLRGGMISGR